MFCHCGLIVTPKILIAISSFYVFLLMQIIPAVETLAATGTTTDTTTTASSNTSSSTSSSSTASSSTSLGGAGAMATPVSPSGASSQLLDELIIQLEQLSTTTPLPIDL